jgi:hypothetical protein
MGKPSWLERKRKQGRRGQKGRGQEKVLPRKQYANGTLIFFLHLKTLKC